MSGERGTLGSAPILRMSGLTMSFGGLTAVSDLSFEFSPVRS